MQNNVNNGKSHEKYWRLRQEPKPNGRINLTSGFIFSKPAKSKIILQHKELMKQEKN